MSKSDPTRNWKISMALTQPDLKFEKSSRPWPKMTQNDPRNTELTRFRFKSPKPIRYPLNHLRSYPKYPIRPTDPNIVYRIWTAPNRLIWEGFLQDNCENWDLWRSTSKIWKQYKPDRRLISKKPKFKYLRYWINLHSISKHPLLLWYLQHRLKRPPRLPRP